MRVSTRTLGVFEIITRRVARAFSLRVSMRSSAVSVVAAPASWSLGGALEERVGIEAVHVEGRARQEEVGEGGEGLRAAVFGGAARPADGLAQVDPAAPACPVVDAEAVLRLDDARKCGFGEPSGGFLGVGASPASALVKAGEFVLGLRVAPWAAA